MKLTILAGLGAAVFLALFMGKDDIRRFLRMRPGRTCTPDTEPAPQVRTPFRLPRPDEDGTARERGAGSRARGGGKSAGRGRGRRAAPGGDPLAERLLSGGHPGR